MNPPTVTHSCGKQQFPVPTYWFSLHIGILVEFLLPLAEALSKPQPQGISKGTCEATVIRAKVLAALGLQPYCSTERTCAEQHTLGAQ